MFIELKAVEVQKDRITEVLFGPFAPVACRYSSLPSTRSAKISCSFQIQGKVDVWQAANGPVSINLVSYDPV